MRFLFNSNDGFSLLELLVAIAILSMAVIPLLATQTTALRSTSQVNEKVLARIVAQNALIDFRLSDIPPVPGFSSGNEHQAGVDFTWQANIRNIPQQPLSTISLSVMRSGQETPIYQITGFRNKQ